MSAALMRIASSCEWSATR